MLTEMATKSTLPIVYRFHAALQIPPATLESLAAQCVARPTWSPFNFLLLRRPLPVYSVHGQLLHCCRADSAAVAGDTVAPRLSCADALLKRYDQRRRRSLARTRVAVDRCSIKVHRVSASTWCVTSPCCTSSCPDNKYRNSHPTCWCARASRPGFFGRNSAKYGSSCRSGTWYPRLSK